MNEENKTYMITDSIGNPLPRKDSQEANPFIYYSLRSAFLRAEKEIKEEINGQVSVIEMNIIETLENIKVSI